MNMIMDTNGHYLQCDYDKCLLNLIYQYMEKQKSQKQLLQEEFQLVAPNLKSILVKKTQLINYHERQLLVNTLKKVIFIKSSFDTNSPKFIKMALSMTLQMHRKNDIVFDKGEVGEYFYIVLEGLYCVQIDNEKEKKKEKQIYYNPGDSFGQVSLIYNVPRGARIVADQASSIIKIHKDIFNQCGNLQQTILYLNKFFQSHPYFQKQTNFMIRVLSSLSKLVKFKQNEVIIEEGMHFSEILFFVKGEAKVVKNMYLQHKGLYFEEIIEIDKLGGGDVFGESFYLSKEASNVKIIGQSRGQYIKVSFKEDIRSTDTPISKRIRQNAARYPTDQQILDQYKIYCLQKLKQLEFLGEVFHKDKHKNQELILAKKKLSRVSNANLSQRKSII